MTKLRAHLTVANVLASLALFVALAGSAYAAATITGRDVKNGSLTGADVRNGSLAGKDVKRNSLTGANVRGLGTGDIIDGSLLARDFKAGQLPAGARGPQGPKGSKGDPGEQGLPGTPLNPSAFYTKTESDARFAPLSSAGDELDIPGTAFVTIDSATTLGTNDLFGVYEKAGDNYLSADLGALPRDARITSIDFLLRHDVTGLTQVFLSQAKPATGGETILLSNQVAVLDPAITTVTITPSAPGYKPAPGIIPLLFWLPGETNIKDIIYGARVHYTLDP